MTKRKLTALLLAFTLLLPLASCKHKQTGGETTQTDSSVTDVTETETSDAGTEALTNAETGILDTTGESTDGGITTEEAAPSTGTSGETDVSSETIAPDDPALNARELYDRASEWADGWKSFTCVETSGSEAVVDGESRTISDSKTVTSASENGFSFVSYSLNDSGSYSVDGGLWQLSDRGYFSDGFLYLMQKALSDEDAEYLCETYFLPSDSDEDPDPFTMFSKVSAATASGGIRITFSEPTQTFYDTFFGEDYEQSGMTLDSALYTVDLDGSGNFKEMSLTIKAHISQYGETLNVTFRQVSAYDNINGSVKITAPSDLTGCITVNNIRKALAYDSAFSALGRSDVCRFTVEDSFTCGWTGKSVSEQASNKVAYKYDESSDKLYMSSSETGKSDGKAYTYQAYFDGKVFWEKRDGGLKKVNSDYDEYGVYDYIYGLLPAYGALYDMSSLTESTSGGVYTISFDINRTDYGEYEAIRLLYGYCGIDVSETYISVNLDSFKGEAVMNADGEITSVKYSVSGVINDGSGENYAFSYSYLCRDIANDTADIQKL